MDKKIKSPYQIMQLKEESQRLAMMAKMTADLLRVHETFIDKLDEVNKVIYKKIGPQGPKPSKQELAKIIYEVLVENKDILFPTVEDIQEAVKPIIPVVPTAINGETPSDERLLDLITPLIPKVEEPKKPVAGFDYFTEKDQKVFLDKILQKVFDRIDSREKKEVDTDALTDSVLEKIQNLPGKKLSAKHIDGLEQTMSAFFNQLVARGGYLHGGGVPSLTAGSNITLTPKSDGGYIISSSGGGGSFAIIPVAGTIDDTNKIFTSVTEPTVLVIRGLTYQPTGGDYTWSWSAGTITLNEAIGTGGSIFGL